MKNKKIMMLVTVLSCMAASGLGSTVAYYTTSEHFENQLILAGENGICAVLEEPSWDPKKGLLVIPNQIIPKDPQVTNTSECDLGLSVALQAEFVYGKDCPEPEKVGKRLSEQDMKSVAEVYHIDYNADDEAKKDWIRFHGEDSLQSVQHFYYRQVLKRNLPGKGDTTVPLFTQVTIPSGVNNEQYKKIQNFGGIEIRITGSIVQQMTGEKEFGLNSAEDTYEAGLFVFDK